MAEDHSQYHDLEDPGGFTPQQLASMRWKAIEAFNCAPGLSPMARRVGCALISAMDAKTRNCYPSELRIASQLGVNLTSVKNAKAELGPPSRKSLGKDKGHQIVGLELISWFHPKGPRHLCHYSFNWPKLLRLCAEAKKRAEEAMNVRRQERGQGSLQATNGQRANGSHGATMEKQNEASNGSHFDSQGSHLDRQGSLQATAKVAVGLPELSHRTTQKDITKHNTPSEVDGGARSIREKSSYVRRRLAHLQDLLRYCPDGDGRLEKLNNRQKCRARKLLDSGGPEPAIEFVFSCTD